MTRNQDPNEKAYVLGTNDEELDRLGLQHRVWRSAVLECWQRAGIKQGWRILDAGAGPGFATADLAEIVGPTGSVDAVERSKRFAAATVALCQARGLSNVRVHELDLMTDALPVTEVDAAWCRWVASFVSSPDNLVAKLAGAMHRGGVAIFHEYCDYGTWQISPPEALHEEFVGKVMQSWRANGGEPDVARVLPSLLAQHGFEIRSLTPRILCVRPGDYAWQWPASFIKVNSDRLAEIGLADKKWAASLQEAFARAEANPNTILMTPLMLEIIAVRR